MDGINLVEITQRDMLRIKKNNAQFSLRGYARYLGISPATLSEFLRGKRDLSWPMVEKISKKLNLSEQDLKKLSKQYNPQEIQEVRLGDEESFIVQEWHYFALLSLLETKDFKSDVKWISSRLGLKETIVKKSLKEMHKLKLLGIDKNGNYYHNEHILISTDEIPSKSVKSRHHSNMSDAGKALAHPLDVRDFTFSTIAINPSNIPKAKKIIRDFQRKIETVLEKGEKKEVYEICISLFPRTKINS